MSLPNEPITREEMYLAKIAGQNVDIPDEPISRVEMYLDAIAKQGGTGEGDMKKSVYDSDSAVSTAGGIKPFVNAQTGSLASRIGQAEAAITTLNENKAAKTDIARVEDGATASAEITKGTEFYHNNVLYTATTTISQGASIVTSGSGQNCEIAPTVTSQIQSGVESAYQLVEDTVGWAGKNQFNPADVSNWNNWTNNNGTFTNTATDTRSDFVFVMQGRKNGTWVKDIISATIITTTGKKEFEFSIGENDDINQLYIGHSGAVTNIVYIISFVKKGTFKVNFNALGIDPTTIGGLVLSEFMFRDADIIDSTYEPYHATVDEQKCDNSVIALVEDQPTCQKSSGYAVGEHFIRDGAFCTCKQAISQGGSFTLGTNYTSGDVASVINNVANLIVTPNTTGDYELPYPDGFNKDNTIVIAIGVDDNSNNYRYGIGTHSGTFGRCFATLMSDKIYYSMLDTSMVNFQHKISIMRLF